MIAWNAGDGKGEPYFKSGYVGVCEHPDRGQLPETEYWSAPFFSLPRQRDSQITDVPKLALRLKLMVEAWHMVYRDAVPIENVHAAFSKIPEYVALLADDFEYRKVSK